MTRTEQARRLKTLCMFSDHEIRSIMRIVGQTGARYVIAACYVIGIELIPNDCRIIREIDDPDYEM